MNTRAAVPHQLARPCVCHGVCHGVGAATTASTPTNLDAHTSESEQPAAWSAPVRGRVTSRTRGATTMRVWVNFCRRCGTGIVTSPLQGGPRSSAAPCQLLPSIDRRETRATRRLCTGRHSPAVTPAVPLRVCMCSANVCAAACAGVPYALHATCREGRAGEGEEVRSGPGGGGTARAVPVGAPQVAACSGAPRSLQCTTSASACVRDAWRVHAWCVSAADHMLVQGTRASTAVPPRRAC